MDKSGVDDRMLLIALTPAAPPRKSAGGDRPTRLPNTRRSMRACPRAPAHAVWRCCLAPQPRCVLHKRDARESRYEVIWTQLQRPMNACEVGDGDVLCDGVSRRLPRRSWRMSGRGEGREGYCASV